MRPALISHTIPAMTASEDALSLAADFEPATRQDWQALVANVLAKSGAAAGAATLSPAEAEAALRTASYDGFELSPLYTAADLAGLADRGVPGRTPFGRGATADGPTVAGWDVRQRHEGSDAAEVNRTVLADLENGATSIWLRIGGSGLPVTDLDRALRDVYLDLAPIVLQAPDAESTLAAATALLACAGQRGVPGGQLRGNLGADPIGWYARTGSEPDLQVLARLVGMTTGHPQLRAAVVDGTVYHDAGGSDSDEIAVATAVAVAYLRALTGAGLSVPDALAQLEFRFAVTADQFSSIAKLRAARLVWARVAELSGVAEPSEGQRQHAVTSAAMLTRRDPWVNMLRTTIGCFAAAVGGAAAITVLPFDSAIGLSDDFARRIARNTQSVLHDESSLGRVLDPAGGSFFVESLTEQLAEVAWRKFTDIERAGGAVAALRAGHIPDLLRATREARQVEINHRRDAITGVSEFAFVTEPPVRRPPAPAVAADGALLPVIRYAEDFEALRDRSDSHAERTGRRPVVFLAGLGPSSAHSGRSGFAANLFQAAGIEPLAGSGQPEELAAQFRAAGTTIACLCSSDRLYAELAAPAAEALVSAGARTVYLAGRPGERADSDRAAGISGYLSAGMDALALLRATLDELEVQ